MVSAASADLPHGSRPEWFKDLAAATLPMPEPAVEREARRILLHTTQRNAQRERLHDTQVYASRVRESGTRVGSVCGTCGEG